jgi:hypothetical protein
VLVIKLYIATIQLSTTFLALQFIFFPFGRILGCPGARSVDSTPRCQLVDRFAGILDLEFEPAFALELAVALDGASPRKPIDKLSPMTYSQKLS